MFSLSSVTLNRDVLTEKLSHQGAGAVVVFEGWVRNHNQGKEVRSLEYQVYEELSLKEGAKILDEAKSQFNLHGVLVAHRHGHLQLGEIAVWIGATASHRDDAFKATRFIIDEIKQRLPIWKKEHYVDQKPEWVFCRHHHQHVHFEEANYYEKQLQLVTQDKLKDARVLVVGVGGLGCPASICLAQAGVGHLTLVDGDKVSISNIHRQSLYSPHLVGEKKVNVAKSKLAELNPFIRIITKDTMFDFSMVKGFDLILDCTDNMRTKYLIHDACFRERVPLISASVYKHEGLVRTFVPGDEHGCLRCHITETPRDHLLGNCNDFGALGAITNALGSIQASEAIEFLNSGLNSTLFHTLFFNLKDLSQMKIKNHRRSDCYTCEGKVEFLANPMEIGSEFLRQEGVKFVDIRELKDHEVMAHKSSTKKVVLCCHRGARSLRLTQELRSQGYHHFYSLMGGACSL